MHNCTALRLSNPVITPNWKSVSIPKSCFSPCKHEYRGRKEVMDYLQRRFLQYSPKLSYRMKLQDVKLFGDALWCTYDYEIVSPKEHLVGRGMSMCRKDGVRRRILNMHNSLREPEPAAVVKP